MSDRYDQLMKNKSIRELQEAMLRGDFTCVELVEYYLERIAKYNDRVHAILFLNKNALEEAKAADMRLRKGDHVRPLEGIPVVVKDCINVVGMPVAEASNCVYAFPTEDASFIKKIREAGAIFLAKTNLTEFAMGGMGNSSRGGQTTNPFDFTRTAGGSSSGSAVSVACDFAAVAIGSDTINSLRSPACSTSVIGMRPTHGSLRNLGSLPCKPSQDICGPMGRTVDDIARVLTVMNDLDEELTAYERMTSFEGCTFGLLRQLLSDDEDVNAVVDASIKAIEAKGGKVVDFEMPEINVKYLTDNYDMGNYGVYDQMNPYVEKLFGMTVEEIRDANKACPEVQKRLEGACAAKGQGAEIIREKLERKEVLTKKVSDQMDAMGVDALLYPHQSYLIAKIGDPAQQRGRNGIVAAITGFPAIVIAGGFSKPDENAPIGVPIGIEISCKAYEEKKMFALAQLLDETLCARKLPVLD
ncbi:MAG: amidase [Lachnospiraceae bacterium]|nr:amidase [Lachnospiraceae bacterium]